MSRLLVFLDYEEGGAIVLPQLSTACLPRILRPHLNLAKPTSSACSLKVLLHMLMPYLRIRPTVLPVTLQPRESLPNFLGWECSCFFILMAILNVFLIFNNNKIHSYLLSIILFFHIFIEKHQIIEN